MLSGISPVLPEPRPSVATSGSHGFQPLQGSELPKTPLKRTSPSQWLLPLTATACTQAAKATTHARAGGQSWLIECMCI